MQGNEFLKSQYAGLITRAQVTYLRKIQMVSTKFQHYAFASMML